MVSGTVDRGGYSPVVARGACGDGRDTARPHRGSSLFHLRGTCGRAGPRRSTPHEAQVMNGQIRSVLASPAKLSVPVDQIGDNTDLHEAGMTSHAGVTVMLALEN